MRDFSVDTGEDVPIQGLWHNNSLWVEEDKMSSWTSFSGTQPAMCKIVDFQNMKGSSHLRIQRDTVND